MAAPTAGFTIDQGRIRLDDTVFVYLERTLAPDRPLPADVAPRAYGLLPIAISPSGTVIGALGPGEAVWLGFQPIDPARPAVVRVRVDRGAPLDAITGGPWNDKLQDEPRNYMVCPPDTRLSGMRQGLGYAPFGPVDLTVLSYDEASTTAPVVLMTSEAFTRLTGIEPEPLNPDSAYKGWRLP